MKFYPRLGINIISLLFILLFTRLSYWQWERHLFKQVYIQSLQERLKESPKNLGEVLKQGTPDFNDLQHRRVSVSGTYDFAHEMALRNRRFNEQPGIHVLTPMRIDGTDSYIIVDRGFAPYQYATRSEREKLERNSPVSFTGLVKASFPRTFMSPSDPTSGPGRDWVDAWLRVDIENISKQLPYSVLPFYVEVIPGGEATDISQSIIQTKDGKAEIFMPKDKMYGLVATRLNQPPSDFPVAQVDTVLPPARHLGYVFEWGAMAIITFLIAVILQLRPARRIA